MTLGDVTMFNAVHGLAVSFRIPAVSRASDVVTFDLVATSDAGRTWKVVSRIGSEPGGFAALNSPTLSFVNARDGFALPQWERPWVTDDGGLTWHSVVIPGAAAGYLISASTTSTGQLAITRSNCTTTDGAPSSCPTTVAFYRPGSARPFRVESAPAVAGQVGLEVLSATYSPDVYLVPADDVVTPGRTAEFTANAGVTWHPFEIPCYGPRQIVTSASGALVLDCFVDGGMMQGISSLWTSTNAGATWHRVACGAPGAQACAEGNMVDVSTQLVTSNDHRVIYAAWSSAAGGVGYSTDGTHWHWNLFDGHTGGAQTYLSADGASGAIFSSPGDIVARTTNGTTWTTLRAQPNHVVTVHGGFQVASPHTTHAES